MWFYKMTVTKYRPRPCFVATDKIIIAAIILFIFYFGYFRHPRIVRSDSQDPMASLVLTPASARQGATSNGIPRIIHQTWISERIPSLFRPWIRSWLDLHPDWEYWFWTDEDMDAFIAAKYPWFVALFRSYPIPGYRVDAFRYLVLFEYGGVYADIDMEVFKPLTDYIQNINTHCFVAQEPREHAHFLSPVGIPLVSNALIGCSPGHPFLADVIQVLPSKAGMFTWNDVLHATGPFMLTGIYKSYKGWRLLSSLDKYSDVHLAEPDDFNPTLDDSMVDNMRASCLRADGLSWFSSVEKIRLQNDLCQRVMGHQFNGKPPDHATTNHHWTHTWHGSRYDPWGVFNDIHNRFSMTELLAEYKTNQKKTI